MDDLGTGGDDAGIESFLFPNRLLSTPELFFGVSVLSFFGLDVDPNSSYPPPSASARWTSMLPFGNDTLRDEAGEAADRDWVGPTEGVELPRWLFGRAG